MSKKHRILAFLGFFFIVTVAGLGRAVEARSAEDVRVEFQHAFDKMYAQPGNVEATLHYAKLAVEMKDYEAALSPLERLLMINPQLPEVRLELGVMYFNLDSKLVAKEHLSLVAQDATASDALKERAQTYLAQL